MWTIQLILIIKEGTSSCSLLSGLPQGQGENGGRGGLYINTPYGQVLTSCSWQCTCGMETACLCQLTGNNLPLSADWKPFAHISWLETVCPNQLSVKAARLYQLTGNGLSLSADDKQKPINSLFWADRKQLARTADRKQLALTADRKQLASVNWLIYSPRVSSKHFRQGGSPCLFLESLFFYFGLKPVIFIPQ